MTLLGCRDTNTYAAYGLQIRSAIPLSEFPSAPDLRYDVSITCKRDIDSDWTAAVREQDHALEITDNEARFWFKNIGTAKVRFGSEIVITPDHEEVEESLLRLYVQGMLMGAILYQRGLCVLHASVIEICKGEAIACLGSVGAGKSSLAAALYSRGHRILTDDNAAIEFRPTGPVVVPGYPYVKLFPAVAESLGIEKDRLHVLNKNQNKVAGAVKGGFSGESVPLRAMYVLDREHAGGITRIPSAEATIQLVRNAIPTRWGHASNVRQFRQCAALVRELPVFLVRTFQELSEVCSVAEQLETHYQSICERAVVTI